MAEFLDRAALAFVLGIVVALPFAGSVLVYLLVTGNSLEDASRAAVRVAAGIFDGVFDQI